ncbi:MAG: ketoacyl-ACP synthase III [bacterium]|nr:ketoacyl-ACP synthase III [bacterium]
MTRAHVIGAGQYLPEQVLTNSDVEKLTDTSDEWIRKRTGIHQRHAVSDEEATSDLARGAALQALARAGVDPADVDLILCCTTTPDYVFPSTACIVQGLIGARGAAAYDINAACSGFVYGLTSADAFVRAGVYQTVLVIGADVATNRMRWESRDTAVLFGDGAGAVVVQARDGDAGVMATHLGADGSEGDLLHYRGGGSRIPPTAESITGPDFDFKMKGAELFKRAVGVFSEAAEKTLQKTGLTAADLDLFVPHQANIRIIQMVADRLGLTEQQVMVNIHRVANTTAASIPIALDDAVQAGRVKPGATVMVASFGAGLTWGSAIIRW